MMKRWSSFWLLAALAVATFIPPRAHAVRVFGVPTFTELPVASADPAGKLAVVLEGRSVAPIVIFQDAPPLTRRTADELADYIEKISGARPEVIEGEPKPLPEHAIWVGCQPVLKTLFPDIDFEFTHPEEILIAANDNHVVIAGRDRWDPEHMVATGPRNTVNGVQQEYGTANAVYTFIQDVLDVRWLWPGESGEDIIAQKTIALGPFVYRYHPSLRSRALLFSFCTLVSSPSAYGHSHDWTRLQRIQLDSLYVHPGHAFKTWWDRFHETHPEYFALQPDGTRGGGERPYPAAETVKMCESCPGVWTQWLGDVMQQIEENPGLTCFTASPNDGYGLGNCVCANCRAWDQPDADLRPFIWQGLAQRYVALSDRDVTFANHCASLLKERYPDRDYYVAMNAYGNSRPAPLKAVPADNVVISDVANMFWSLDTPDKDCIEGKTYAQHYADWGKVTVNQVWRPNTGNPAGWQNALPDIPIERVMQSFQFAIDNHCIGIVVDSIMEQWATQGPLYYVLAQKTWDPSKDWRGALDDYYRRGFGPAANAIKAYWTLLEESRNRKVDDYPGEANGYVEVYNEAFFEKAYGLLDRAATSVEVRPAKYLRRIEFVRVGLDHVKLLAELRKLSLEMLRRGVDDTEIADQVRAKWDEVQSNCEKIPHALYWPIIRPGTRMARGGLFHPDYMDRVKKKQLAAWKTRATAVNKEDETAGLQPVAQGRGAAVLQSANQSGWELLFEDTFDRTELGPNWKAVTGTWTVDDGALRGSGILVSKRAFPEDGAPAFLRMEYEAIPDVQAANLFGAGDATTTRISDLSGLLHVSDGDSEAQVQGSGYFFQFGGRWNTLHQIVRAGDALVSDVRGLVKIKSIRPQTVVVENDQGHLHMFVDGRHVLSGEEKASLLGDGHNRVGFYFYTAARVLGVKVYARRLSEGLDEE